jgi:stage V sporulation protein B
MNKTQKSFVQGAAVLGAIGLICKVIGAIYRIPMTDMIGTEGMAYYSTAYPVYTFLLAISSAGLPVAISKMVSERVTLKDSRGAHMVFKTAMKAMIVIGLITTALMAIFSHGIATALGRSDAGITILAIAPALFFVSVLSAYRGYFQGLQIMSPTAFSQLIEQAGKLGVGLFLAYMWKDYGLAYAAAGAVLGVTISEVLSLAFLLILYNGKKKQLFGNIQAEQPARRADRPRIGRELFYLALPIIIGACAMPLVLMADNAIVTNTLNGMNGIVVNGSTILNTNPEAWKKIVNTLYGTLTGVVNPLINLPAVLSMALAMSLVPAISTSKARRDDEGASRKSGMGFKLALLVGLPCAVGFYLLSTPIVHLLFSKIKGSELATAGNLLAIMSIGVLFLTALQTMTGILQGLGKTYVPVVNLFIGIAVKVVVSLIFIRIPEINVKGAAIGTVACYAVAAVLDVACVIKYAKLKLDFVDNIVKPVLAAAVMGAFVYFLTPVLSKAVSEQRVVTAVMILAAGVLYVACVFLFGALKRDDMEFIPGGRRMTRLMVKLKIWKGNA